MENNLPREYIFEEGTAQEARITISSEGSLTRVIEFLVKRIIKLEEEVKKLNNK